MPKGEINKKYTNCFSQSALKHFSSFDEKKNIRKIRRRWWLKRLWAEHLFVSQHLAKISSHKTYEIDITFQVVKWPHVDHVTKGSCGFKGGSILQQVSIFHSLVSTCLLQVEIYSIQFVTWPHETRGLKVHVTLWVGFLMVCQHPAKNINQRDSHNVKVWRTITSSHPGVFEYVMFHKLSFMPKVSIIFCNDK